MALFATYAAYLAISVGLTVAVGSALSRSGRVFLASVFGGDERLARAVSRLLVVGFYLLSLGFITLTAPTSGQITSPQQAFGVLLPKIGAVFLVLGGLQAANVVFFTRFRRRPRPEPDPAAPGPSAVPLRRPAPGGPSPGSRQAVH